MRGQTMIGYQFEKDFSNGLTFRQNARYAHVDVNINSYIGNGNVSAPANATLQRYRFLRTVRQTSGPSIISWKADSIQAPSAIRCWRVWTQEVPAG